MFAHILPKIILPASPSTHSTIGEILGSKTVPWKDKTDSMWLQKVGGRKQDPSVELRGGLALPQRRNSGVGALWQQEGCLWGLCTQAQEWVSEITHLLQGPVDDQQSLMPFVRGKQRKWVDKWMSECMDEWVGGWMDGGREELFIKTGMGLRQCDAFAVLASPFLPHLLGLAQAWDCSWPCGPTCVSA